MDKRYNAVSIQEQIQMREKAYADVLANPQWPLRESVLHIKKVMRLTTTDIAKLSKLGYRTVQDIESGASLGTVKTMNQIFGIIGLRLGVVSKNTEDGQ